MKQLREPLLLIALATFFAFIPFETVRIPVCVGIALSLRIVMGSRVATDVAVPLLVAFFAAALTALVHVGLLLAHTVHVHVPLVLDVFAPECAMSVTLLALAWALSRLADAAGVEGSPLWLSAIRVLFLAGAVGDAVGFGGSVGINLLACPWLALLVLQLRARLPLPDAQ